MNPELLSILCHPQTHEPLQWVNGHLTTARGHEIFPVRQGIPQLVAGRTPFRHRIWAWVYNRTAFAYDWGVSFAWRLPLGGQPIDRQAYLEKIHLQPGDQVLETAVGTGANLQHFPAHARYVGLDISYAMLLRCQQNLARWGREAALVQGDAQALPFREGVFDAVVHMGGLQFLTQPRRALADAWRVTKPGGRIWIIDEAYSLAGLVHRSGLQIPLRGRPPSRGMDALLDLVPSPSDDIHAEWISHGELYFLSFRKCN